MSVFLLRFLVHNSPLSPCFAPLTMLCGSLEFRLASSHTVGARLPPPFTLGRHFLRDLNPDTRIIEFRIAVSPAVILFLRDVSRFQQSGLLFPGLKPLFQIRRMDSAVEDRCPDADHAIHVGDTNQIPILQREKRIALYTI